MSFLKRLGHNIDRYLKQRFKYQIQKKLLVLVHQRKNAQQNAAAKLLKILNV